MEKTQTLARTGERHPRSRLTAQQVIAMRLKYYNQTPSTPVYCWELAKEYGVSATQCARIVARKQWRSI